MTENVKTETSVEVKDVVKKAIMKGNKRKVDSTLMNKEEVFKLLALAESLRLPILLVGVPGTGKTNIVTDYTKSMFDLTNPVEKEHFDKEGVFLIETDEGTKSSEIKGMVDLEELVLNNRYQLDSPITKATTIIINEVDKASSSLRNALLGIMNEKVLFTGKDKIPCNWNLFVATCNEIPKDEINSPFWDRFFLKITVNRLSAGNLIDYYKAGDRNYTTSVTVNIPSIEEIDQQEITLDKLEKFVTVAYQKCSDRTLSFAPRMAKACALVYNVGQDKALIKACELLVDKAAAEALSKQLLSQEKRSIMDKVDMLAAMRDEKQIETGIAEVETMVQNYISTGKLNKADVEEISVMIEAAMAGNPYYALEVE